MTLQEGAQHQAESATSASVNHDGPSEGWALTTLGEVARLQSGTGFPLCEQGKTDQTLPFFKVRNLGDVEPMVPLMSSNHTVDDETAARLCAKVIPPDAVVFAKIGMAIALNRRRRLGQRACIDNNMMAAIPQPSITSKFLHSFLSSVDFMPLAHSTTVPSLRKGTLEASSLSLPPLAEQMRIVKAIERLKARVDSARERLANVPKILKRFRQAVLAAACSGRLTEDWRESHDAEPAADLIQRAIAAAAAQPGVKRRKRGTTGLARIEPPDSLPDTWVTMQVREMHEKGVLLDYQDGNHGELYPRKEDFGDTGVAFLAAKQVFDNRVDWCEAPLLSREKAGVLRIGFAQPDDVLLTHNATVGRVAILPADAGNCILGTSVTYYRCRPGFLNPEYLSVFMQSALWQNQLRLVMEQTTRNQVSVKKQAEFIVVIPPAEEQEQIVRVAAKALKLVDAIEQRIAAATVRADKITQAVLANAFRGELVPTEAELARTEGREFESAAELLERVATSTATDKPSRRKRPRKKRV